MSKKKNTLKDLDEFLKQQAATLVEPAQLSDKIEAPEREQKVTAGTPPSSHEVTMESILKDLHQLSGQEGNGFRRKLYDLIIRTLESQPASTPEDKMLINTALYLKSGDSWRETIRGYWRNK